MVTVEDSARAAMLARLAGAVSVIAEPWRHEWTCCFQGFTHPGYAGRDDRWSWRFCNGGLPGRYLDTVPCRHWHHRYDPIPLAAA